MDFEFILGVLLGILAALMLNIGKGIQKQKVHVLLEGRGMFARGKRGDLGIWCLGMAITAGAAFPYSLGLMLSKSPSTIAAMTGVGLIGLLVYALKVIGEKVGKQDGVGITLVIVGTSLLGYLGASNDTPAREFVDRTLVITVFVMVAVAATACLLAWFSRRVHGTTFGLAAGLCIGLAIFLADVGLVRSDGSFSGQLSTPYPFVAIGFAIVALVTTQFGFIRGKALEVVPSVNAATILTPLILEMAIYGAVPPAVNLAIITVILAGVFLLSTGAVTKVSV